MRGIIYVLTALAVIGLGFWAYHENYATQASVRDVRDLHARIGAGHERLNILQAEWAYLNRPDRLRDLVEINFDRLGLLPLMPDGFGRVDQVSYPPAPLLPITDPVEVSSDGAASTEEPL
jgi:hypothetical protein